MAGPIEEEYFNWLCAKVISPYSIDYLDLMKILYSTEFVWSVVGDKNRKEDGIELRDYFINETRYNKDRLWFNQPCSVLEVLIAFAGRASFQTDAPVRDWFWVFMDNLNLIEYRRISDSDLPIIEGILYAFVWRTYESNGYGGLFPLDNRALKEDQRDVEIWYQFCAWVDEKDLI